jgi:Icc-related predicted phosphoesterase
MKLLAVSDEVVDYIYSPRITDHFADIDLVLGCGDVPFYYLEYIVTVLNVPLFYVPGNHDRLAQYHADGRVVHRAEGCEVLDQRTAVFPNRDYPAALPEAAHGPPPGLLLAGLGGSMRYNQNEAHQYNEAEMLGRMLSLAPRLLANRLRHGRALDILVTHAPPRGIHDATDLAHTGFQAFRLFMDVFRPRLLLHGHSHVYRNDAVTVTRYKDTRVINVYPYRVIEWPAAAHEA